MTLKDARLFSGKTQEEAAAELGVTIGAISQWEHGLSRPRWAMVKKVAKCYGVSVEELFDDDD